MPAFFIKNFVHLCFDNLQVPNLRGPIGLRGLLSQISNNM